MDGFCPLPCDSNPPIHRFAPPASFLWLFPWFGRTMVSRSQRIPIEANRTFRLSLQRPARSRGNSGPNFCLTRGAVSQVRLDSHAMRGVRMMRRRLAEARQQRCRKRPMRTRESYRRSRQETLESLGLLGWSRARRYRTQFLPSRIACAAMVLRMLPGVAPSASRIPISRFLPFTMKEMTP